MADDITLTIRVRDMSRGEFQRLEGRLNNMKRSLQGVNRSTASAGMHSKRLAQDINKLDNSFKKMERTGNLTKRELTQMKNTLDSMSRSALNAARNGEITADKYRTINDEVSRLRGELSRLDHGLNNNTRTLRNHNGQTRTTIRMVNGMTQSIRTATRSIDGNTQVVNTWRNDLKRTGSSLMGLNTRSGIASKLFGNMHAKLIALAVVLGASLLPTIGALAPMVAGLGAIVGVAALAFMGLSKPTRMLTKDQKEFLKGLKPLRNAFHELQRTAQKAILPGLTKSFGNIEKAMKSMNPVLKIAGKGFSDLVDKTARGISSDKFMGPFLKNVKMGVPWVEKFAASFGHFLTSFFEFGAKSKPALDAWQDLLGGFLERGLPGMFKNMESGIKGASEYLLGLSSLINDGLLPGLGTLVGKFMEAFGPTIGKLLRGAGQYFDEFATAAGETFTALAPAGKMIGNVVDSLMDLSRINFGVFFDTMKEVGGALLETFTEVFAGGESKKITGPLKNLSTWVRENEGPIRAAFTNVGITFIDMVNVIVQAAPTILRTFRGITNTWLDFVGAFLHTADTLLGDIPGIGDKIHGAREKFDEFSAGVRENLDKAVAKSQEYADKASPNLERAQLRLRVDEFERQLNDAKTALKDPTLTKERRAKLTADKRDAEQKVTEAKLRLAAFGHEKALATLDANHAPFFDKARVVRNTRFPKKDVPVGANPSSFWGGIRNLVGRVLGTSYINVAHRLVDTQAAPMFHKANGGVMKFFANGGENHTAQIAPAGSWRVWGEPETGGEAYIPLAQSKRSRSRAVAEDTVGMLGGQVEWFARGGHHKRKISKQERAEQEARNEARGDLTISHFGKMAGYKNDEFKKALGLPESLGSLVDSLNHWRSVIMKSTHGAMEKSLLKQLDKAGRSLIKYEKNLTKVDKALEKAKSKLDDLKSAAASLRESVTSGVMSATDITKAASGDKNLTMTDIMGTMQANADKATAFSDALKRLRKRGVSKEIIAQIAQAGIEGGGLETAGTILTASDDQIKKMNEQQKKINKSAKDAGKTAADAMYAAGIKAAEGMVHGLKKKKKDIEKAMMDIAKAMEKAIKRALKIHSPSQVMQEVGHYTAEGFAVGIKKNQSVGNAWESMLTTGPGGGGYSSTGGGGSPQVVQLVISGRVVDEIILDSNRRTVRTRGGNVQAVYGR